MNFLKICEPAGIWWGTAFLRNSSWGTLQRLVTTKWVNETNTRVMKLKQWSIYSSIRFKIRLGQPEYTPLIRWLLLMTYSWYKILITKRYMLPPFKLWDNVPNQPWNSLFECSMRQMMSLWLSHETIWIKRHRRIKSHLCPAKSVSKMMYRYNLR